MGGLWASRAIWRRHPAAERRLYFWAATVAAFFAALPAAFPYAFAGRADVWPAAASGAAVFALFVAGAGWYLRRHRTPAA